MEWNLDTVDEDGAVLVLPRGELDLVTAPLLSRALVAAEDRASERVVLDLRDVAFMDSSGLAAILEAVNRAADASAPAFGIINGTGPVHRVFVLADLIDQLPFVTP